MPSFVWKKRSDRKSTRLNSSHTIISYAAFCFKKNGQRRLTPVQPSASPPHTPRRSTRQQACGDTPPALGRLRPQWSPVRAGFDLFFSKEAGPPEIPPSFPPEALSG